MAFAAANFHRIWNGPDQSLYLYNSPDAIATIVGSGYFNSVSAELRENDVIIVVGLTGGAQTVDVVVITSADGAATVTTTNGT